MISLKSQAQILLLGSLSFVLSACPTLMTRTDVKEVEQKKTIQDSVQTLQKANADVSNRFAEIEEDARQTSGRVEVLENRSAQAKENQDQLRRAQDEKIAALSARGALSPSLFPYWVPLSA